MIKTNDVVTFFQGIETIVPALKAEEQLSPDDSLGCALLPESPVNQAERKLESLLLTESPSGKPLESDKENFSLQNEEGTSRGRFPMGTFEGFARHKDGSDIGKILNLCCPRMKRGPAEKCCFSFQP